MAVDDEGSTRMSEGQSPAALYGGHLEFCRSTQTSMFGVNCERTREGEGMQVWQAHAFRSCADDLADALQEGSWVDSADDVITVSQRPGIVEYSGQNLDRKWEEQIREMRIGQVGDVVRMYKVEKRMVSVMADLKVKGNARDNAVAQVKCLVSAREMEENVAVLMGQVAGMDGACVALSNRQQVEKTNECYVVRVDLVREDQLRLLVKAYRTQVVPGFAIKRRVAMTMAGMDVYKLPQVVLEVKVGVDEGEMWDVIQEEVERLEALGGTRDGKGKVKTRKYTLSIW